MIGKPLGNACLRLDDCPRDRQPVVGNPAQHRRRKRRSLLLARRLCPHGFGALAAKAGPRQLLGQMKLAMTNPYNVYLHDSPAKCLFSHTRRAYSHGCVRVGDALGFAATLLEGNMTRRQIDTLAGFAKPDLAAPRMALAGLAPPRPSRSRLPMWRWRSHCRSISPISPQAAAQTARWQSKATFMVATC